MKKFLICLTAWFCAAVWGFGLLAYAQAVNCDLTVGCHFELVVGTKGTYDNYVVKIGPDAANLTSFTFPIAEPKTTIQETQVGVVQKFSGTIVKHQTIINLYDDNGNLMQTQNLESKTGGTPVAQQLIYTICATSQTEPEICTAEVGLTAT